MSDRWLTRALILAALVRLGLVAIAWNRPGQLLTPDSADYTTLAASLTEEGRFARDGQVEIFRTPGYPFFLLIAHTFGEHGWRVVVLVQALLDVLLVYLTYLLATMLAGQRAGVWAALFQALCPVAAAAAVRVLSDSLYALLLTISLCLMISHFRSGRAWMVAASAAFLAAACYVRPVGLVMAALFALVLLARPNRWRRVGLFAGILAMAIAPWVVRNAVRAEYAGFSSFATDSVYFFAVPELRAEETGKHPARLRAEMRTREQPVADETGCLPPPGPAAHRRAGAAVSALAEHPWAYARLHLRGCLGVFLPGATDAMEVAGVTTGQRGTSDVLRRDGLWAAVRHYFGNNAWALAAAAPMVLLLAIQYLAVGVAVVRRTRLRMPASIWLPALMVVAATLVTGPFGQPRYRVPVTPILSAAAGLGVTILVDAVRRRRTREG